VGQKFINPIHEPEKLVVAGLYKVSHVDGLGVDYLFKQESGGMSVIDFFGVGDYFVVMKPNPCWPNPCWLELSQFPFDLWCCRVNALVNITTSKLSLGLEDFLVIQIVDGDEQETPP
jgi:hypothetical protein